MGLKRLAREVGVGQSHLSRVERGVAPASEPLLRRLAGVLGADVEVLLVASGRLPSDIRGYLLSDPVRVLAVLREEFSRYEVGSHGQAAARPAPKDEEVQGCRQDGR